MEIKAFFVFKISSHNMQIKIFIINLKNEFNIPNERICWTFIRFHFLREKKTKKLSLITYSRISIINVIEISLTLLHDAFIISVFTLHNMICQCTSINLVNISKLWKPICKIKLWNKQFLLKRKYKEWLWMYYL